MALSLRLLDADLVATHGARCMDGSPGGLYLSPAASAANASRLVLYLEGGGECRTARACAAWASHSGSSSRWPARFASAQLAGSPMDPSARANPDFHDWARLVLPYCSADLHAGTRRDRSAPLGGWYFAGHRLLVGALAQLRRAWPRFAPTHVLVTGSSAGGIGALLHADFFGAHWPAAAVKVSPAAGYFYPGAPSQRDFAAARPTPDDDLAMLAEWRPYLHEGCAAATNRSRARCSSAHQVVRYVRTPLFVRENLFDPAKLANCGLDVRRKLGEGGLAYLRAWGEALAASLEGSLRRAGHGYFVPSCLAHASNLGFESAPAVRGVRLREAMRAWFFSSGGRTDLLERCGGLPCSNASGAAQYCPHLPTRECRQLCQLARRRRRVRNGLDAASPGRHVCLIHREAQPEVAAVTPAGGDEGIGEWRMATCHKEAARMAPHPNHRTLTHLFDDCILPSKRRDVRTRSSPLTR
ncbi:hypothetical protein AB1Y20_023249 [Prymnesium parvum]|uniref:Pectin acetylesterase n=1 Tax=Prymnesium parvum TaxID=97485 RepID=A0AB34JDH0_PRYPA